MMWGKKLVNTDKSFFYSEGMLFADREHVDIRRVSTYYDILYGRARMQAESITGDGVLASKIFEQILECCGPSINEGKGVNEVC
jgi:hypothetical protein